MNGDLSFPEHFLDKRDFIVFKDDPAAEGKFSSTEGVLPAEPDDFANGDREFFSTDFVGVFERGVEEDSGVGVTWCVYE